MAPPSYTTMAKIPDKDMPSPSTNHASISIAKGVKDLRSTDPISKGKVNATKLLNTSDNTYTVEDISIYGVDCFGMSFHMLRFKKAVVH